MRQSLKLHPDSSCPAVARVEVEVSRPRADRLVLSYMLTGNLSDVRIPPVVPSARSDELWRHTCFEAFIGTSSDENYYEFNFSPSTQWAAYRFSAYRSGLNVATEIEAPPIEVQSDSGCYTLQALIDLDRLSALPQTALWRLGLSAVIESSSGRKSYWALAHPPGKPDFHHPDCFAFELRPTVPS